MNPEVLQKIIDQDAQNKLEMTRYDLEHRLEALGNYKDYVKNKGDLELAHYIRQHLESMDEEEMFTILKRIVTTNGLKSTLLRYELENLKPEPKPMTLDEFQTEALKLLNRYQCRAGGFCFEDRQWTVYEHGSMEYTIHENEILFENSIGNANAFSSETDQYLENIIDLLNGLSDGIEVECRMDKTNDTIFILLWVYDRKMEVSNAKIDL